MGTNYFARVNCCQTCGRFDERHIGKQSSGWPFILDPGSEDDKGGLRQTWAAWKELLAEPSLRVFDEYGHEEPVIDFIELVERSGARDYSAENMKSFGQQHLLHGVTDHERRDPQGYRFSKRTGFS